MWIPKLVSGEWGATICVSEPDAGSDVGRIRTAARRGAAKRHGGAAWLIRGEKMWISYGDHDLTERIGHIVLARIEGADRGIRGLSLFLVPSLVARPDGSLGANHVIVRRVEEKLGLHGSPTCALGFEDAEGVLIGSEGRGVAQLFSMIVAMRLQVGSQGLGLAEASYRAAFAYAQQRRQGGPADAPPVTIATHADVQLTLVGMASRICTLRGLVYTAAVAADLADLEPDATARESAASLQAWLLPIIKNSAAETSFAIAADAILLFGGAGYTTEWPVERYLRDARVLAIYEGTGGMQALDLVKRRWRVPGTGCEAFLAALDADLVEWPEGVAAPLRAAISTLVDASRWLRDPAREDWEIEAAARAALRLATDVAHGWIGARLATLGETDATHTRLAAYGRHALSVMAESVAASLAAMHSSPARLRNCAGL
jgi:alkylation response protein AidB-like acyl-CoA dehydrogenase